MAKVYRELSRQWHVLGPPGSPERLRGLPAFLRSFCELASPHAALLATGFDDVVGLTTAVVDSLVLNLHEIAGRRYAAAAAATTTETATTTTQLNEQQTTQLRLLRFLCAQTHDGSGRDLLVALDLLATMGEFSRPVALVFLRLPSLLVSILETAVAWGSRVDMAAVFATTDTASPQEALVQPTLAIASILREPVAEPLSSTYNKDRVLTLTGLCVRLLNILTSLARHGSLCESILATTFMSTGDFVLVPQDSSLNLNPAGSSLRSGLWELPLDGAMENQVIVQRYVLRVISRLIYHLTIFRVDVERIQQLQLIPRLVKVMQARGELAGEVYLEIAQVIVNAVIKSSKLTFSLLNELKQANAVAHFVSRALWMAKHATEEASVAFVTELWQLAFVGPPLDYDIDPNISLKSRAANPNAPDLTSLETVRALLLIFEQCSSTSYLQLAILALFRQSLSQNSLNYCRLKPLSVFRYLFNNFHWFHVHVQSEVCAILTLLVTEGHRMAEELQSFCGLLEGHNPHTALLLLQQMNNLIDQVPLCRSYFHVSGLLSVLMGYLCPISDLPFHEGLTDVGERKVFLHVMMESDRYVEFVDRNDKQARTVNLADVVDMPQSAQQDAEDMIYEIVQIALTLVQTMITGDSQNQALLHDQAGLEKLAKLFDDATLRVPALRIMQIMARTRYVGEWGIIQLVVRAIKLQDEAFTASKSETSYHVDVLRSLQEMLRHNELCRKQFREAGGFEVVVILLQKLVNRIEDKLASNNIKSWGSNKEMCDGAVDLIVALLRLLSEALSANAENQLYFQQIVKFQSLLNSLSSSFLINPSYSLDIAELVLNLAIHATWSNVPSHLPSQGTTTTLSDVPAEIRLRVVAHELSKEHLEALFEKAVSQPTVAEHFAQFLQDPEIDGDHLLSFYVHAHEYEKLQGNSSVQAVRRRNEAQKIYAQFVSKESLNSVLQPDQAAMGLHIHDHINVASPLLFHDLKLQVEKALLAEHFEVFITSYCETSSPLAMSRDNIDVLRNITIENPEVVGILIQLLSVYYNWYLTNVSKSQAKLMLSVVSHVFEEIMFLIEATTDNCDALCKYGLTLIMLDSFKGALKDANSPIQAQLLNVISQLGRYSFGKLELRCFLTLLRDNNFPTNLLTTLCGISDHFHRATFGQPRHYLDFNSPFKPPGHVEFALANESTWPPSKGYTVSFWFRLTRRHAASSPGKQSILTLLQIENREGITLRVSVENHKLLVKTVDGDAEVPNLFIEEDHWYHIILTQSHTRLAKRATNKMSVYVDGFPRSDVNASYPTSHALNIKVTINSPVKGYSGNAALAVEFGNLYVFEDVSVDDLQAFMIYAHGGDYIGQFNEANLGRLPISDLIDSNNVANFSKRLELINKTEQFTLKELNEKIIFVMSCATQTIAHFATATSVQDTLSMVWNRVLIETRFNLTGAGTIRSRCSIKDSVMDVGGMSTFVYLAARVPSSSTCICLRLIRSLCSQHTVNFSDFKQLRGYDLVGKLLTTDQCILDEDLIDVLIMSCTLSVGDINPMRASFGGSSYLVTNGAGLSTLCLDWRIWRRATHVVQEALFNQLVGLVRGNPHSAMNIELIRQAGGLPQLLYIFQEQENFPPNVMTPILEFFHCLLHSPPTPSELLQIVSFLVVSYSAPSEMISTARSALQTPSADMRHHFDFATTPATIVPENFHDIFNNERMPSVRDELLQLILDALKEHGEQLIEDLYQHLRLEQILAMINTPSEKARYVFLQIIDLYVHTPSIGALLRLQKVNGFMLLGYQLKRHGVSSVILTSLYSMALGKPLHVVPRRKRPLKGPKVPDATLAKVTNAAFLTTILTLMPAARNDYSLWTSEMQKLQQLFTRNPAPVQEQNHLLLETSVDLICDLLPALLGGDLADDSTWRRDSGIPQTPMTTANDFNFYNVMAGAFSGGRQSRLASLDGSSMAGYSVVTSSAASSTSQDQLGGGGLIEISDREIVDLSAGMEQAQLQPHPVEDEEEPDLSDNELETADLSMDSSANISVDNSPMPGPRSRRSLPPLKIRRNSRDDASERSSFVVEDGSHEKMVGDVVQLLKGLTREGCRIKGPSFVEDVMTAIMRLENLGDKDHRFRGLAHSQILSVQRQVLKDVLEELNRRTTNPSNETVGTGESPINMFMSMVVLSVDHIVHASVAAAGQVPTTSFPQDSSPAYLAPSIALLSPSVASNEQEEYRFIQVVFGILAKSMLMNKQSEADGGFDFLPFFASQMAVQEQLGRLILFLLSPKRPMSYREFAITKLAEPSRIIMLFTNDREFNLRVINTVKDLLMHRETHIKNAASIVVEQIFTSQRNLAREIVDNPQNLANGEEIRLKENILREIALADDRQAQGENRWRTDKNLAQHKRVTAYRKTKRSLRSEATQLSSAMMNLQYDRKKHTLVFQRLLLENELEIATLWTNLVQRITHSRGIWAVRRNPAKEIWQLDRTEGPCRKRSRLHQQDREYPFLVPHLPEVPESTEASPVEATVPVVPNKLPVRKKGDAVHEAVFSLTTLTTDDSDDFFEASQLPHLTKGHNEGNQAMLSRQQLGGEEKISVQSKCTRIMPFTQLEGELLISSQHVYFFDDQSSASSSSRPGGGPASSASRSSTAAYNSATPASTHEAAEAERIFLKDHMGVRPNPRFHPLGNISLVKISLDTIKELHKRRYLLKNNAIEIFVTTGKTYLLAFGSKAERDSVYDKLSLMDLPHRIYHEDDQLAATTQKWVNCQISNFEYLMHLNTMAGRTFNDLTQYPVFPFILADYASEELDLTADSTFRDLTKPMGAQSPDRLAKFLEKFRHLKEMAMHDEPTEQPYLYGSHYSNLGIVLYFLVRVEPFTQYFLEFQGGRFDIPDRSFHSIKQTWHLSSSYSTTDVKELIPEFFFFPELFSNLNQYDLGLKQDGQRVNNVILPPWAKGDPRLFVRKHLQALESAKVSENLHVWIDLIFGSKQMGEEAEKALNLFHPLTYEGAVDADKIDDEVQRTATIAQISSYGQTPARIFKKDHPKRKTPEPTPLCAIVNDPSLSLSRVWKQETNNSVFWIEFNEPTVTLFTLGPHRLLLRPEAGKMVSWNHWDCNIRLTSVDTDKTLSVVENHHNDPVTACANDDVILVSGGQSGVVKVWEITSRRTDFRLKANLHGHSDAITAVSISHEFSLMVTGSGGYDCSVILWDLNKLSFVRSLDRMPGPIVATAISQTTGDIVVASLRTGGDRSDLTLWTVNGSLVNSVLVNDKVSCVAVSSANEGINTNIIAAGFESGYVQLWSSWDLTPLRRIQDSSLAITAVAFSLLNTCLLVGNVKGEVSAWSRSTTGGASGASSEGQRTPTIDPSRRKGPLN